MVCIPTNRVYIGITTQPLRVRFSGHVSSAKGSRAKLGNAIRKYGADKFRIEWIASSWNFENLLELECILIAQYDSHKHGLNSTSGGEGVLGFHHTKESRARMSASRVKVWQDPGYRDAIGNAQREAWERKDTYELAIHSIRARKTAVALAGSRPKKVRPAGPGKGWNMAKRSMCKNGHPYVEGNFRLNGKGARICLICKRKTRNTARDRRRREKREYDPLI